MVAHRATHLLHSSLSVVSSSASSHISPRHLRSSLVVSGQFFLCLPLFLFPPAFHAITCLAVLPSSVRKTCPIHLNLLILMIVSKVSSPVIFLTSLLVTLSRHD